MKDEERVKRYCADDKCGIRNYQCSQCEKMLEVIKETRKETAKECAEIAENSYSNRSILAEKIRKEYGI